MPASRCSRRARWIRKVSVDSTAVGGRVLSRQTAQHAVLRDASPTKLALPDPSERRTGGKVLLELLYSLHESRPWAREVSHMTPLLIHGPAGRDRTVAADPETSWGGSLGPSFGASARPSRLPWGPRPRGSACARYRSNSSRNVAAKVREGKWVAGVVRATQPERRYGELSATERNEWITSLAASRRTRPS
jgi:hypothetical protein